MQLPLISEKCALPDLKRRAVSSSAFRADAAGAFQTRHVGGEFASELGGRDVMDRPFGRRLYLRETQ
jgi:hypothetical protein